MGSPAVRRARHFDTRTEDIVRNAAVTRGTLYHHFADKKALFEAVFGAVENDLMAARHRPGA